MNRPWIAVLSIVKDADAVQSVVETTAEFLFNLEAEGPYESIEEARADITRLIMTATGMVPLEMLNMGWDHVGLRGRDGSIMSIKLLEVRDSDYEAEAARHPKTQKKADPR